MGDSYEKTAVKEAEEETGLKLDPDKLKLVTTIRNVAHDEVTKKINNVIRKIYAYEFNGVPGDLKIERGEGAGFELIKIESLFTMDEKGKKRFIPTIFKNANLDIFRKIKMLLD